MDKCIYKIKTETGEQVFSSYFELDNFIKTQLDNYEVTEMDKTFSVSLQTATLKKLDEAKIEYDKSAIEYEVYNSDGDVEIRTKIPNSISMTRLITEFGNPSNLDKHLVSPFNVNNWRKLKINEWMSKGLSEEEANEKVQLEENSWKYLTDYGTEIHGILQSVIDKTEYSTKLLTESQIEGVKRDAEELIAYLKRRHGDDAKFFSEMAIKSKELNKLYHKGNRHKLRDDGTPQEDTRLINSVNGRVDLLVIDKNGVAHVYDFKVSRKPVGDWSVIENRSIKTAGTWHSTKKLMTAYQLTGYRRMLEQYNIKVGSINVVPIHLDLIYTDTDKINIEQLNAITLDVNSIKTRLDGTDPGGKIYKNMETIFPIEIKQLKNIDIINKIAIPFNKAFPDITLSRKVQSFTATYEFYRKKKVSRIPRTEISSENGKYKFKFYDNIDRKVILAESEEDLKPKLEAYIAKVNSRKSDELHVLADNIRSATKGELSIEALTSESNLPKRAFLKRHFQKYIENGWTLTSNDDQINLGLFTFEKDNVVEIIVLSNEELTTKLKLSKGTTLLGNFIKDQYVDTKSIYEANNGYLGIIMAMFYLNSYSEFYVNKKVQKIQTLNIWNQTGQDTYNELMYDNFRRLCDYAKIKLNLTPGNFYDTFEQTVYEISDMLRDDELTRFIDWTVSPELSAIEDKKHWIEDRITQLTRKYPALSKGEYFNVENKYWQALNLLRRALNQLNGYYYYIESNPDNYIGFKGGLTLGSYVTSPGTSNSKNIQQIAKLVALGKEKMRKLELDYHKRYTPTLESFYRANNVIQFIGQQQRAFTHLFATDESGNIDPKFRLKSLDDESLTEADRKMISIFLEIINELRYGGNADLIEEAKLSGNYYLVPLKRAEAATLLGKGKFKQIAKNSLDRTLNWRDLFAEQVEQQQSSLNTLHTYNKYEIDSDIRERIITEQGINRLETNLENILLEFIHEYASQKINEEMLPLIQGFKIGLMFQEAMYGQSIDRLVKFIEDYAKVHIYSEPIMEEGLRPVYRFASVFKNIASTVTLGYNFKSGFRETLQGTWIGFSRAAAQTFGRDQFSLKDWTKAYTFVVKEAPNSIGKTTLLEYLNWDYGMANADADSIYRELNKGNTGILNFKSENLFIAQRSPDMLHRMTILIAKMLHDGCYDAYSVVDDTLVYDFKKDARFSKYLMGMEKSPEYKKQKALYLTMLEQFNKEGYNLKIGDPLPRAYTNLEAQSVKSFADICYGHYDKNTQMMLKYQFIGSFMMQFRTFLSAKMEQWILKPGIYNQGNWKQAYDSEGNKIVYVITYDENGVPSKRYDVEKNMKEGDLWEYHMEWQGIPQEGIAYSILKQFKEIRSYEQFVEYWKDPLKRGNLKLFFHDMIIMAMFSALVKYAFDWDNLDDAPAAKKWIGLALWGSFQDGPIQNVIGNIVSTTPPSVGIVKNLYNTWKNFVIDDTTLWDATASSFGALREFKGDAKIF